MFRLYNTASRKKDEFVAQDPARVTMYCCGPTVYNFAHIGNLRTYIFEDFSYVEGEWNTGFVIEDKDKNQYVWVPCSNIENIDVPKLEKIFILASDGLKRQTIQRRGRGSLCGDHSSRAVRP